MGLSLAIIVNDSDTTESLNFEELSHIVSKNKITYKISLFRSDESENPKYFMIPFVNSEQLRLFKEDGRTLILKLSTNFFSVLSTKPFESSDYNDSFLSLESIQIDAIQIGPPKTLLPNCPVCLKRFDKSISGLNVIKCRDLFHYCCQENCRKISENCPVCQIIYKSSASSGCSDCGNSGNLWICLICANLGCGRYKGGHAHNHFTKTGHAFVLKLESHHIWDYTQDKYVHWKIKNAEGTVVDVDEELESSDDTVRSDFANDFTTAQLESQKAFYENKIQTIKNQNKTEILNLKTEHEKIITNMKEEMNRLNHERKIFSDLTRQLQNRIKDSKTEIELLRKDLEIERKISQGLSESFDALKLKLSETESEKLDLEEEVKDLMKHIEILDLMGKSGNDPDIVEGKLMIFPSNRKKKLK